jgi:hypothetical protein
LLSPLPTATNIVPIEAPSSLETASNQVDSRHLARLVFGAAIFLISVPVFVEAPMVRYFPWITLVASLGWAGLSVQLMRHAKTRLWGELLVGFTWTWVCGAIFWGWLRWQPEWHLPIEALAVPIAVWGLRRRWAVVGNSFYLGSLLGTAITDLYFYAVDLIPAWKQLMNLDPRGADLPILSRAILTTALQQTDTPWGAGVAIGLLSFLLATGIYSFKQKSLHWVAFSGAILSTILVDGLFWLTAAFA